MVSLSTKIGFEYIGTVKWFEIESQFEGSDFDWSTNKGGTFEETVEFAL